MKRIWLDVTDFLSWHGNFTGLQRIQYNIAKRYISEGYDIHFFVYHESQNSFLEVDFVPDQVAKQGIVGEGRKAENVSKSVFRRLHSRTPNSVKRLVKTVHTRVHKRNVQDEMDVISPFQADDIVLVLGGIWFGNFISDLKIEKQKRQFIFIHFIHDMIPVLFPGFVVEGLPEAFATYKETVFNIADGLIANSVSTAKDASKFMKVKGISIPPITVVRIGEELVESKDKDQSRVDEVGDKDFILSVGTIEGRKNHIALFYAMKEAKSRGINLPKIVIVGRPGWLTEDIRYMIHNDVDARSNMLILEDTNDHQLSWLYQNCLFTVYPSFYEGWGMPIAESLAYGKLCLASNTSSMTEIAGDLIDYYSPSDSGALLECMVKYLDKTKLKQIEARIKKEYKPTTWDDMFRSISIFIDDLATN